MKNLNIYIRFFLNILFVSIIIYLVVKLFIFLLPVILILIGAYYVYRIYKEVNNKSKDNKSTKEKGIIDAEIINEKFDK